MDFSMKFVSEDREFSNYEKYVPAPLFRKSFELSESPESAEIMICGLGMYDLFVNGSRITKGCLAPYIGNTDHYIYYDKYDIKKYLRQGENVIGVMLGDGHQNEKVLMWDASENVTNSAPKLALSVEICCENSVVRMEADSFVCKKGPILFNDVRSGIFYDARLEEDGWNQPGFVEKGWHMPLTVERPRGKAKICGVEPVRVSGELKPVSIQKGGIVPHEVHEQMTEQTKKLHSFEKHVPYDGGYIYDFGENNSGIYRLKIKGYPGQKIDLQCGEQLTDGKLNYNNIKYYPDGYAQRDIYYLKGGEEEIFEPQFTYHGYRYVYVYGITEEQATEELLTYLVMSSELPERGTFECSDERANAIYRMGRRSDISNFFYFPVDCPHREKNGWTGDASVSAEHMMMTIGAENSWREWLCNIRAAQHETGIIPCIVPTGSWGYGWGSGPAWDNVIFNLPYVIYRYRGDKDIILENAHAMMRYLEYVSRKRDERGIVGFGLGDWLPVGKDANDYTSDIGFTDSVMVLDMCRKGAEMFEAAGLPLHRDFAERLGQEMYEAIRREYIDFDTYVVRNRCDTSQAMALFFDIFTEEEKERGFAVLMEILGEENNNFTCGFLGLRVLFHVLAQFGQANLAYHMITKKDFPSYGYWLDKGETTFLEYFDVYDTYFEQSKNHHFMGDVVNWLMRCPGGLNVVNAEFVQVKPCFIEKLDWCRTTHRLPQGEIEICWRREAAYIDLKVTCDESIGFEVVLPEGYECRETARGVYKVTAV